MDNVALDNLSEIQRMQLLHFYPELRPQRLIACARCIGGTVLESYGRWECLNCGTDYTPGEISPPQKVSQGMKGIPRKWGESSF